MDALQTRLGARFERQMRNALAKDYADMVAMFEKAGAFDPAQVDRERTGRIILAGWEQTASVFGERFIDQVGKRHNSMERKDLITDIFKSAFGEFARRWIATKVTQVAGTTIDQIRTLILRGESEGQSVPEIGKAMRQRIPILSALRANTIARTETHMAAGWANQQAAEIADIELMREWCSAEDARTRPDHYHADGQKVGLTEHFRVGSSRLEYPGDPSGPPDQVINCRCQALYIEP